MYKIGQQLRPDLDYIECRMDRNYRYLNFLFQSEYRQNNKWRFHDKNGFKNALFLSHLIDSKKLTDLF